jgi:hypothetical protein
MSSTPSPADLRAAIARRRVPIYVLAPRLKIHPTRLGAMLSERVPLPPETAERIAEAIEQIPAGSVA